MDIPQQIAEAIKGHEARLHKRNGRFVPPTVAEVAEYAGQGFDAEGFVDFYESKGWMVGNQKMKSWKAAVRTWARRETRTGKTKLFPIPGKLCSEKGCGMPAVYKWATAAGYDFWSCANHLPDKVKEQYCG